MTNVVREARNLLQQFEGEVLETQGSLAWDLADKLREMVAYIDSESVPAVVSSSSLNPRETYSVIPMRGAKDARQAVATMRAEQRRLGVTGPVMRFGRVIIEEPAPLPPLTIAEVAEQMGFPLLPWQQRIAEALERGDQLVLDYPASLRAGRRTFRRILARWNELTANERSAA